VPKLTQALTYGSSFIGSGQSRLLAIFAGLNVFSMLLIFLLVPETAGATLGEEAGSLNYISLEELNYIFGVSTRTHIEYQVHRVLPWAFSWVKYWCKRWILRKRKVPEPDEPLEELYTWFRVNRQVMEKMQDMETPSGDQKRTPTTGDATAAEVR
jgi:hypothetical protein